MSSSYSDIFLTYIIAYFRAEVCKSARKICERGKMFLYIRKRTGILQDTVQYPVYARETFPQHIGKESYIFSEKKLKNPVKTIDLF